jgi:hypothetical protein
MVPAHQHHDAKNEIQQDQPRKRQEDILITHSISECTTRVIFQNGLSGKGANSPGTANLPIGLTSAAEGGKNSNSAIYNPHSAIF